MRFIWSFPVAVILVISSAQAWGQRPPTSPRRPEIVVHVMPWFEAKPTSADWGWHWRMNHFDPDKVDAQGQREIASHDIPAVGPCDSLDPDLLEYHTLSMRIAGVDGAIVDWYGSEDFNDYGIIHRRTLALVDALRRRNLRFGICYEDRVLKTLVEQGKIKADEAVAHAKTHLWFAARTWFTDPAYLQWHDRPLLMVFGPDYLQPEQWDATLASLPKPVAFITLHERRGSAVGSFAWPPMWASKNGVLDAIDLVAYLARFAKQEGAKIPAAFPGFHDIYAQSLFLKSGNGERKPSQIPDRKSQTPLRDHFAIWDLRLTQNRPLNLLEQTLRRGSSRRTVSSTAATGPPYGTRSTRRSSLRRRSFKSRPGTTSVKGPRWNQRRTMAITISKSSRPFAAATPPTPSPSSPPTCASLCGSFTSVSNQR